MNELFIIKFQIEQLSKSITKNHELKIYQVLNVGHWFLWKKEKYFFFTMSNTPWVHSYYLPVWIKCVRQIKISHQYLNSMFKKYQRKSKKKKKDTKCMRIILSIALPTDVMFYKKNVCPVPVANKTHSAAAAAHFLRRQWS